MTFLAKPFQRRINSWFPKHFVPLQEIRVFPTHKMTSEDKTSGQTAIPNAEIHTSGHDKIIILISSLPDISWKTSEKRSKSRRLSNDVRNTNIVPDELHRTSG